MSQNGFFSFHGSRLCEVQVEADVGSQVALERAGRPVNPEDLYLPGEARVGDAGPATEAARRQGQHQVRPGEENGKQAQTSPLGAQSGRT